MPPQVSHAWAILLGYALGSIPFAVIVTRWMAGVDVRETGSGHSGATNTMRAAGWRAGIAVMLLDVGKGWLAVTLATSISPSPWLAAAAGMAAVAGHCWPVLAGFRGGRGVAVAGGAFLALWPLGFVIGVGLAAMTTLVVRHAARGLVLAGLLIGPVWLGLGAAESDAWIAAAIGLLVAVRAVSDWNREYHELWLDRPPDPQVTD